MFILSERHYITTSCHTECNEVSRVGHGKHLYYCNKKRHRAVPFFSLCMTVRDLFIPDVAPLALVTALV